jgi:hypothetical protein
MPLAARRLINRVWQLIRRLALTSEQMDERQKIDWGLHAKKLLLQLEKRQALPTNHPYSMAKLEEEIAAVEELIRHYRRLFAHERLRRR